MKNVFNKEKQRIVSGMRATGVIHLGNYHSVLKNWINLQHTYDCFFFVADLHVLTTNYNNSVNLNNDINKIVIDWLSAGLDPDLCNIFVQSFVPEHVELYLLLSMITPVSWLNRMPTYKEKISDFGDSLLNYGFLGYPLLQAADILLYKASYVPVGEDQITHIEFARNVVKKFNYLYMSNINMFSVINNIINCMQLKNSLFLKHALKEYCYKNCQLMLDDINNILSTDNLTIAQKNIIYNYFNDNINNILIEPKEMLLDISKLPGIDGKKMSKSNNNTIYLTESPVNIKNKINLMVTDDKRKFRYSCGNANLCSVFILHKLYSSMDFINFILSKCENGKISCKDCKRLVIDNITKKNAFIRKCSIKYIKNPELVQNIIKKGTKNAREIAIETLNEIKCIIGI